MARGEIALTKILPTSLVINSANKGKRSVYMVERDNAIAARFYYLSHLRRLRYDDCLMRLEKEFFLTALYISQRLPERSEYIKTLVNNNTDRKQLRKLFTQFCWD